MKRRSTRRGTIAAAVLCGCAAVVMVSGRMVPALREVPAVVWITTLALIVAAGAVIIRNRRSGDR